MRMNLAKMFIKASSPEDIYYDQECHWGCRVSNYCVYCDNEYWGEAPTKCNMSWFWGEEGLDKKCPGFKANSRDTNE